MRFCSERSSDLLLTVCVKPSGSSNTTGFPAADRGVYNLAAGGMLRRRLYSRLHSLRWRICFPPLASFPYGPVCLCWKPHFSIYLSEPEDSEVLRMFHCGLQERVWTCFFGWKSQKFSLSRDEIVGLCTGNYLIHITIQRLQFSICCK